MLTTILVTGAGGAVGQFAVEESIARCNTVIATDLPGCIPQKFKDHPGIVTLEVDLTTDKGFQELRELVFDLGADGIINTAAVVDIGQPWEVVEPVNVTLVRNLFELGVEALASHFVHISSASIYTTRDNETHTYIESDPISGTSPYEWSKVMSERLLESLAPTQQDMNITIVRPSLIYGPRCRFLGAALAAVPSLLSKVSQTTVGFTGGPKTNWVHCEDVARACVHLMFREDAPSLDVFNVCGISAPGFGDVITEHIQAYGLKTAVTIPLPPPKSLRLLKFVLTQDSLFDKVVNPTLQVLWGLFGEDQSHLLVKVDKEAVPYAFNDTVFSSKALRETGFNCKWSLVTGIRDAVGWYKRFNWI